MTDHVQKDPELLIIDVI